METNEISSKKEWTFKRALRVSLKFALLYAILSMVPALIFKSNFDIVLSKVNTIFFFSKEVTLHNFGLNLILNIFSFFLSVMIIISWLKMFKTTKGLGDALCNKEKEGDKNWIDAINFFYGFGYLLWACAAFVFALRGWSDLGLGVSLLLGSIHGFIFFLIFVLIIVIIWIVKVLISKEFWAMIGRGILSGLKYFWRFLIQ